MDNMDSSIFTKYDIRGSAEGEGMQITPDLARKLGLAFGTYLQRFESKNEVVVGRDSRRTSYDLSKAAINGLKESGCRVIDLELVATPIVYWQAIQHEDAGALMITGSHLGPVYNGFKIGIGSKALYGTQLKLMSNFIRTGDLTYGNGSVSTDRSSYTRYIDDAASRLTAPRPLKVVVDAGNGTGGLFAPRILQKWGQTVAECIYCQPDGNFHGHPPNPQDADNLLELGAKVIEHNADVGIAFDADADRVGFVNERGQMVKADRITALLARDMLSRQPGATVIGDVLSSQVLFDTVEKHGGKAVMWSSGHSLIRARMHEINALLAGETSGHIFCAEDYYRIDDAFIAAGRLLALIGSSEQTLSELDDSLPRQFTTPEYRPYCPHADKQAVIDGVRDALREKGRITKVDGVRVRFDNGWGLIRASNTEEVLSLRFEGVTEADALAYRDLFAETLANFPQVGSLLE